MRFDTEVNSLDYGTIENTIAEYFDLGFPSSSNFPIAFRRDSQGTYTLVGTKGSGTFYISIMDKTDGGYWLSVSCREKIKKKH